MIMYKLKPGKLSEIRTKVSASLHCAILTK